MSQVDIGVNAVIGVVTALGVSGWLLQLAKNKGGRERMRSDELTDFRKSLTEEYKVLRGELNRTRLEHQDEIGAARKACLEEIAVQAKINDKLEDRIEQCRLEITSITTVFNEISTQFATFRAATRTMIMQMRKGDSSWRMIGDVLSIASHDVDRIIIQGEAETAADKITTRAAVVAEDMVHLAEEVAQHVVTDAKEAAASLREQ